MLKRWSAILTIAVGLLLSSSALALQLSDYNLAVPVGSLLVLGSAFGHGPASVNLGIEEVNVAGLIREPSTGQIVNLTLLDFNTGDITNVLPPITSSTALTSQAIKMLQKSSIKPWMTVGPVIAPFLSVASVLAPEHITPVVINSLSSTELSRIAYPFLASIEPYARAQGYILARLCSQFSWNRVGVIYSTVYQDTFSAFSSQMQLEGNRILGAASFTTSDTVVGHNITLGEQVNALKQSGARIFIYLIFNADVRAVFEAMDGVGLVGNGYGCGGISEWFRNLYTFKHDLATRTRIQGCVGTAIGLSPTSAEWISFVARYKAKYQRDPASMLFAPNPVEGSVRFHIAALTVANTFKELYGLVGRCRGSLNYVFNNSTRVATFASVNTTNWYMNATECIKYKSMDTGRMLYSLLINKVSFQTVYGIYEFEDDGTRLARYSLVNTLADGAPVTFGNSTCDLFGNTVLETDKIASASIMWPGNAVNIPLDGARELYDGLQLSIHYDATKAVLAFILSCVGAFVAFLLFEDPLFHAKTHKMTRKDQIGVLTSSLALSLAVVWPSFFISFDQLSVQATSLAYEPLRLCFAWLVVWTFFYIALNVKLVSFRYSKITLVNRAKMKNGEGYQTRSSGSSDETSSASATGSDTTSQSIPRDIVAEVQPDNDNDASSSPRKYSTFELVQQQLSHMIRATIFCTDLYSAVSILLFVLAIAAMEVLGVTGFIVPATITVTNHIIWGAILVVVTSWVAVQLLFHMDTFQWLSSLFIALPVLIAHQFTVGSLSFKYSTNKAKIVDEAKVTDAWDSGTFVLASVLISAVCCFVLIAVQFVRNRITSKSWLRQLAASKRENKSLARELNKSRRESAVATMMADQWGTRIQIMLLTLYPNLKNLAAYAWTLSQGSLVKAVSKQKRINKKKTDEQDLVMPDSVMRAAHADNGMLPLALPSQQMPSAVQAATVSKVVSHTNNHSLMLTTPPEANEFQKVLWALKCSTDLPGKEDCPDIDVVLAHPVGAHLFYQHLQQQLSEENMHIIVRLDQYAAEPSAAIREELGLDIIDVFCAVGAPQAINVSSTMLNHVRENARASHFPPNLFDAVRQEIVRLMQTNNWKRFQASPAYRLFISLLQTETKHESAAMIV